MSGPAVFPVAPSQTHPPSRPTTDLFPSLNGSEWIPAEAALEMYLAGASAIVGVGTANFTNPCLVLILVIENSTKKSWINTH